MPAHAGRAETADFLLVHQHTGAGVGRNRLLLVQQGLQRGIGAGAVVLSIGKDQVTQQSAVAGLPHRNDLQLGRTEILLLDAKLPLDEVQNLLLALIVFLRESAEHQVKVLAVDELAGRLLHLLLGDMGKDVADTEDRILRILADADIHLGTVLLEDHSMDGKRECQPLVLLDAAIVMGVQVDHLVLLINRVGLGVQPGRIDMGAKDAHAFLNRFPADPVQGDALSHLVAIDLVAWLQAGNGKDVPVSGFLGGGDNLPGALTLRLPMVEKMLVPLNQLR